MNNSAIQQGTSFSTQTINFTIDKTENLKKIIDEIKNIKEQITLDRLVFEELVSEIDTLKSQIKSPKPKSIIVTESLKTIRSILEGVAGNAASPLIIDMITNFIK
jgi:septation ring formation regulator EzrA